MILRVPVERVFVEEVQIQGPFAPIVSTFRKPTDEEISSALTVVNKEDCKHTLFYDTPSYMYDIRSCATCGRLLGLI